MAWLGQFQFFLAVPVGEHSIMAVGLRVWLVPHSKRFFPHTPHQRFHLLEITIPFSKRLGLAYLTQRLALWDLSPTSPAGSHLGTVDMMVGGVVCGKEDSELQL